ncbi:MAG: coproporphyrinogen III oxidase [Bacteroidetes bacterium]|nr:MAG: coproporphyrinogen III oxidase [Bacteroidota bacterium]
MPTKETIAGRLRQLQDSICDALTQADGKGKFEEDNWERPGGGGGRTRIMQHGRVIEKGGVNFSAVSGELPENIRAALKVSESEFFATGVSIVIHPESPMVPIIHMNVRYFELNDGTKQTWWFGGGIDLTPHYIVEEDARFFHREIKKVCDLFSPDFYPVHKKWADDYFFIKHRGENRGIGGIFFDRLSGSDDQKQFYFDYIIKTGEAFAPVYTRLMLKNADLPYSEKEKQWQFLRRGRYVEFNLVYDKGTKFGLDTNGRIESILMSLPEHAGWQYNYKAAPGSPEEKTLEYLKKAVDWV